MRNPLDPAEACLWPDSAAPTVNPGDDDEDDEDTGNIEPDEDEDEGGGDDEEEDDVDDPLWAGWLTPDRRPVCCVAIFLAR